ncbi:MAG: hypothetical protein ABI748_02345 [Dokdonella sp.]
MRYLVCLIVGLVVGAITASTFVNATAQREAWPRGIMNVMQHELGNARTATRARQCATPTMQSAASHLQLLATDIEPALLAPGTKDRVFSQYASDLRAALAKWNANADCAQQGAALTVVANTCEACHRDYR